MTLQRFRQTEFWVITALAFFFFMLFVNDSYGGFNSVWRGIDVFERQRIVFRYAWWQNGFWPLLSIFLTTYGCWYALNNILFRRYFNKNHRLLLFWSLFVIAILLTGAWSFLYHWKTLEYRHDSNGVIMGAKVKSLFRLQRLVWFQFSLLFWFLFYTALSQLYQWCLQQTDRQNDATILILKEGSYLTLIGWVIVIFFNFRNPHFPSQLLLSLTQIFFIHTYIFHSGLLKAARKKEWDRMSKKSQKVLVLSFLGIILIDFISLSIFYFDNYFFSRHYPASIPFVILTPIQSLFFHWLIVLGIGIALSLLRQFTTNPLEISLNRNQAELSALRAQINPHFMFNAMNTLYATAIEEKAEKTSQGIQQLSDMMRFMMHENNQEQIDVQQEVNYLRNYIDLQRLRITENSQLELKIDLDDTLCLRPIAPMLLVPFVENAFKHGISLRHHSWIYVKLHCEGERLYFSVFNSLHPRHEDDPEKHASGIGLVNVQKRLELLYPNRHQLKLHRTEKEFSVHLEIDFPTKSPKPKLNSILATYDDL